MDLRLYCVQRLFSLIIVVLGGSVVVFLIMRALPGDPISALMGLDMTPEIVAEMRVKLGLTEPLVWQFWVWFRGALQGDLGNSISLRQPITSLLFDRFPVTLHLALTALVISFLIAIPAGVFAAVNRARLPDHVSRIIALIGVSMPNFWLGLLLIMLFSVQLGWLPPGGYVPLGEDPIASFAHILMPALSLGAYYAATIMRMLRSSMLDVLGRDYIAVATSLGLSRRVVIWNDAFRNALIPTLTVTGFAFGYMLGGTILIEVIFNVPGMGRLLYDAISYRDYPLVQSVVLFNICLFVIVNFIVDVVYVFVDPRIRY